MVSIPVYDAGTQSPYVSTKAAKVAAPRMNQGVAAVKIQSTFRGFCVRNSKPLENLRIIGQVKSDADEIGRRLSTQTQLIRGNEYESRKLDHQILSLLLRLDCDSGKSMTMVGRGQQLDHKHTPEMDSHSHSDRNSCTPETQPQTEEVRKKEENCTIHAADCERDTCEELKGLDLSSSSETVPVPVNEAQHIGGETMLASSETVTVPVPAPAPANEPVQHIGGESIQCDAACDGHGDGIGKGHAAVDKMENDTIKKVLADLYRKVESNDKLINDLSLSKDDDNEREVKLIHKYYHEYIFFF
eukprot:PITA_10580